MHKGFNGSGDSASCKIAFASKIVVCNCMFTRVFETGIFVSPFMFIHVFEAGIFVSPCVTIINIFIRM